MRDSGVFALAGLWERWEGEGESLESCCIIVIPDNDIMKSLHERTPAIIASAHHGLWLDPHVADKKMSEERERRLQEQRQQLRPHRHQ